MVDRLRLLHMADVHLGFACADRELTEAVPEAFGRAVSLAREERVDLVVVAGDLFESNRVSPRTVALALGAFSEIAPAPVVLLPGTHDRLCAGSVYLRPEFRPDRLPRNVHVLADPAGARLALPALDCAIYGRANESSEGGFPLAGLERGGGERFHVALAHGSIAGVGGERDFPISPQDLDRAGMDYVALGHWHAAQPVPGTRRAAWYSGSPQPTEVPKAPGKALEGTVLLVTLEPGGPAGPPEKRIVGLFRLERAAIDVAALPDRESVSARIRALASPRLILRADIEGHVGPERFFDAARLEEELEPHFHALTLDASGFRVRPGPQDAARYPQGSLEGMLARIASERLAQLAEGSEEHELLSEALAEALDRLARARETAP